MKHFTLEYDWLRPILPEGISVPSSTIISGPGGSGKPLIAGMFLASWLKQDGSLIYLLINSGREYAEKVFASCGVDGSTYKDRIVYIDFDPQAGFTHATSPKNPPKQREAHICTIISPPEKISRNL